MKGDSLQIFCLFVLLVSIIFLEGKKTCSQFTDIQLYTYL